MTNQLINIILKTQQFISTKFETKMSGFILNYNGTKYIISVHHFLPIKQICEMESGIELNIKINSCWSEILVLDVSNINLSEYKINNMIQNKLPKVNDIVYIKTNTKRYELKVIGYDSIPFDNIQDNITIPQIKCIALCDMENFAGLSGSPVFIKDKIVGIFSKYRPDSKITYIIPIYIVIKNIEKIDNSNIYSTPVNNIKKVNSYNVKDNEIYHPTLKINIHINTYFLLEGDKNNKTLIQYEQLETKKNIIEEIESLVKNDLISPCDCNIVTRKDNSEYKINTRLLSLLRKFNSDNKIALRLFLLINKNKSSEHWFGLVNGSIKLL